MNQTLEAMAQSELTRLGAFAHHHKLAFAKTGDFGCSLAMQHVLEAVADEMKRRFVAQFGGEAAEAIYAQETAWLRAALAE